MSASPSSRRPAPGKRWRAEETAFLAELLGEEPASTVAVAFRREAARRGWPVRSLSSIRGRARRIGLTTRCRTGEWLTTGGAAEVLGCGRWRLTRWLAEPAIAAALQPRKVGGQWFISRRGFRRLARQLPQVYGGLPRDRLLALLEDVELVDQVMAHHPLARGDYRIRCVETGQVWRSCKAAARHYHLHRFTISDAVQQRRPVAVLGLSFVALRHEKAPG